MNDLSKYIKNFISFLEKSKKSPSTILAYQKDLDQFSDYISNQKIASLKDINIELLENYINNLIQNQTFSLKTISRKINSLRSFFKYLSKNGVTKEDISINLKHPKYENKKPKSLSLEQYNKVREISKDNLRIYIIIEILLQTGMRIGELARLKVQDLKLDSVRPKVRIAEYASCPEREITISNKLKKLLKESIKIRSSNARTQALFTTKTGRALLIRNIRSAVDKYFQKADVKSSVNDLRNTFIVEQLKSGVDPRLIAEYVGHQRLTSTNKFVKEFGIEKTGKENEIVEI